MKTAAPLLAALMLLFLSACASPTPVLVTELVVASAEVVTATASPTAEPTDAPTEIEPTGAPTRAAGSVPVHVPNDFFFGFRSDDCELPCWQGIYVHQSTLIDTLKALQNAYGPPPESFAPTRELPAGLHGILLGWVLGESPDYDSFAVVVISEEKTDKTEALSYSWLGDRFEPYISIQKILTELGKPMTILGSYEVGGQGGGTHVDLELHTIYSNGVSFIHKMNLPILRNPANSQETKTIEFCLNEMYGSGSGKVAMTSPFEPELNLTLPQQYIHGDLESLIPITELFNLSLEELVQQAAQTTNPCFYIPLNNN
jgi:hypothetical protein